MDKDRLLHVSFFWDPKFQFSIKSLGRSSKRILGSKIGKEHLHVRLATTSLAKKTDSSLVKYLWNICNVSLASKRIYTSLVKYL